jgi:hypothetical protein
MRTEACTLRLGSLKFVTLAELDRGGRRMGLRGVWEIKDLETSLESAGIGLGDVCRETGIQEVHLKKIQENHGKHWWKHRTVHKVEECLARYNVKVRKVMRSFG